MNAHGVTATIRANARAQYEEYMAWLRSQEQAKEQTNKV